MFSELIYTRCRQGIDLKTGKVIMADGFKVYTCSESLLDGEKETDTALLFHVAQGKQSYSDPTFMDNAYLYVTPDRGDPIFVEFHPIIFDKNRTGEYSQRPGNFINHLLVGDIVNFYPHELFGDTTIWNAKTLGEAYYYENEPTNLPVRDDIVDPIGQIDFVELRAFIHDGRREALKAAVSFLISQYTLTPEERRFLVIRDESSSNIELWIAAIQYAFSPRIACSIPFATRLDKFTTTNRYMVNLIGDYQSQINLQDPNKKLRYKAMIVGVDERDRANVALSRPQANSIFVLLDGKEKKAMFDADTSNKYYDFITNFDESHQVFCRQFLQMFGLNSPSAEVFQILDVYQQLENSTSLPQANIVAKHLKVLSRYDLYDCSKLRSFYSRIKAKLPQFLKEDLQSAFHIMKWVSVASITIGDNGAKKQLTDIVCNLFAETVYVRKNKNAATVIWKDIKESEFSQSVAEFFVDYSTVKKYRDYRNNFSSKEHIMLVERYLECGIYLGNTSLEHMKDMTKHGLLHCFRCDCEESAQRILTILAKENRVSFPEIMLTISQNESREQVEFNIRQLIINAPFIIKEDTAFGAFIRKMEELGMGNLIGIMLKYRISKAMNATEVVSFIELVEEYKSIDKQDVIELYEILDSKIEISAKGSADVAIKLQGSKPKRARCVISAHLYAIEVLKDRRKKVFLIDEFERLFEQGFPSIGELWYYERIIDGIFKAKLNSEEFSFMIEIFSTNLVYAECLVKEILTMTTPRQTGYWNILMDTASETRSQTLRKAILKVCGGVKGGEKTLSLLGSFLESRDSQKYYRRIEEEAIEEIRTRKSKSGFGKFFNKF